MKAPRSMTTDPAPQNTVSPSPQARTASRSTTKGEVPASLLDRYLIERDRKGRPERFYRDHRAKDPMFRDEGKRLVTSQAYPDAVGDMLKIAQHRGWTQVRVSGDEAFRKEAWVQAKTLGIDLKGYQPRDRDRQAAGERLSPDQTNQRAAPPKPSPEQRLKDAAVVVRRLVADPVAQARLIERVSDRAKHTIPSLSRDPRESRSQPERGNRGRN